MQSGEKCYWKVRAWDKNDVGSPWSKLTTFEMGLLKETDWQGEWIGMSGSKTELSSIPRIEYTTGRFGHAVNLSGNGEHIKIEHYDRLKPAFGSAWRSAAT